MLWANRIDVDARVTPPDPPGKPTASVGPCYGRRRAAATRDWYPALEAAGIRKRGPYALRHTFATEVLAGGISTFELSRLMGTSLEMLESTYGHLVRDSEDRIRERLEARSGQRRHYGNPPGF
jgi:integrase